MSGEKSCLHISLNSRLCLSRSVSFIGFPYSQVWSSVLGCLSVRSNFHNAFLFLEIGLFQANGVSAWHVVEGNEVSFADLFLRAFQGGSVLWRVDPGYAISSNRRASCDSSTDLLGLSGSRTDDGLFSLRHISAELSEEAQASVSHTWGSGPVTVLPACCGPLPTDASIPLSACEDEWQAAARPPGPPVAPSPFVVAVVFVPLVVVSCRGRWLDDWRWLQGIARATLMSSPLSEGVFLSTKSCADTFDPGIQARRKCFLVAYRVTRRIAVSMFVISKKKRSQTRWTTGGRYAEWTRVSKERLDSTGPRRPRW